MPPRLVSHYRVVRRLGAGGMGEVYLAHDTQLERPVALKVMSSELAKDANQRKRFRTEAKAASGLSHPHICVIHEVGETGEGRPFLAMEYVEGQTLDVVLQQRRLKIREVINLGIEVAEALEAAHARGLVHRDIKPGNLMLDGRGQVKVMDFGLAKWFAPDELGGATTSVAHTRTGMLIGTPQYMSPEQALGRPLDPGTDIFSLGVVLYEALAGQRPFLGKTVVETINNIVNQPPAPLGLDNPVYSPALDNIISKCLEKEPEKRYASAKELAADLRGLKSESERALSAAAHDQHSTPLSTAQHHPAPATGRKPLLAWTLSLLTIALLATGAWALFQGGFRKPIQPPPSVSAPTIAPVSSVAVLPFVNLGPDRNDEYLGDGFTEALLAALGNVNGLRVPGRSSSFAFKGKTGKDISRRVGEQLHVEAVVEGSVSKAGDQLRIDAKLINAADGRQLWSKTYDREMTNIFAIQSEVARQVVSALKGQLGLEEVRALVRRATENVEAYKLYLLGRHNFFKYSVDGLNKALDYFNQAIRKDSNYALAYAGKADTYYWLATFGMSAREALEQGKAAAQKALDLDESLPEAHVAMGTMKAWNDWDWEGADYEYRRAIQLNPNLALAHDAYSTFLQTQGRFSNALAQASRAIELDPLSTYLNVNLGWFFLESRQYDRAIEQTRMTLELDENYVEAHRLLGWCYFVKGQTNEALKAMLKVKALDDRPYYAAGLACAYVLAGDTNAALKIMREWDTSPQARHVAPSSRAWVYLAMGDTNSTLVWLKQAYEAKDTYCPWLNTEPGLDILRPDPRFQEILKKMRLVK